MDIPSAPETFLAVPPSSDTFLQITKFSIFAGRPVRRSLAAQHADVECLNLFGETRIELVITNSSCIITHSQGSLNFNYRNSGYTSFHTEERYLPRLMHLGPLMYRSSRGPNCALASGS